MPEFDIWGYRPDTGYQRGTDIVGYKVEAMKAPSARSASTPRRSAPPIDPKRLGFWVVVLV